MNTISITYNYNWTLNFNDNYVFTDCGKCFNLKRNKQVKKVLIGYSVGYNIASKFYTLEKLRKQLVKIKNYNCPF